MIILISRCHLVLDFNIFVNYLRFALKEMSYFLDVANGSKDKVSLMCLWLSGCCHASGSAAVPDRWNT